MKLNQLKTKGKQIFTAAEAKRVGISRQLLHHYVRAGKLLRVSHGIFKFPEADTIDFQAILKEKLIECPEGVIGLYTALRLHNATEHLHPLIHILVPNDNVPKRKLTDVKLHPMERSFYKKEVIKINGIPVTSLERTFIDLLRKGEAMSTMLESFYEARSHGTNVNIGKLKKLSKPFRIKRRVEQFLESLT